MAELTWKPFVLGGIACCTAELVTFPVDVTKVRLQVQGQHTSEFMKQIKYRNMFHALVQIPREEGLLALYRGLSPALLRQATYGTLKLGFYHNIKRYLVKDARGNDYFLLNLTAAVLSGSLSAAIASPTDRIKIRMQSQSLTQRYKGIVDAFTTIVRTEGFKGLYKGVGPTSQRAGLVAGVELPIYEHVKSSLRRSFDMADNVLLHFCSSMVAGLCSAMASSPIDVIKSRFMNQSVRDGERMYTSTIDCLRQTVKLEGVKALYKGFIPYYLRTGPWNVTCFLVFEQLKKLTDD